jgi:hypothetical protein
VLGGGLAPASQVWAGPAEPLRPTTAPAKPEKDGIKPKVKAEQAGAAKSTPGAKGKTPPLTRGDARFDEARRRYAQVLGLAVPEGKIDPKQPIGFERRPDKTVLTLDAAGVNILLQRHWRGPGIVTDAARQQIRRNRGFVALARALKLDPGVGAAQASFGMPSENGLAELLDAVDAARFELAGSPASASALSAMHEKERELEAALARLPKGPAKDWPLADLDLNNDRRIDRKDTELAKAGERPSGQPVRSAALAPAPIGRAGSASPSQE